MNEKVKYMLIGLACMVLIYIGWALFHDVSDDGGATYPIRAEFEHAREEQRKAQEHADRVTEGLEEGSRNASEVRVTIEREQARNADVKAILDENTRLIRESRAILETVRSQKQEN